MVRDSAGAGPARYRRRAVFIRTTKRRSAMPAASPSSSASSLPRHQHQHQHQPRSITRNVPDVDDTAVDEEFTLEDRSASSAPTTTTTAMIPDLFKHAPPVRDALVTDTSETQDETVALCLPYLSAQTDDADDGRVRLDYNAHGVPHLDRARHVRFLQRSLERLPGGFVGYDASRPWLLFWCLNGLALLGEDVSAYRAPLVATARSMQNASGGFGGGHGQASHLATSYAVVMALALVGGEACYEAIDRRALWRWLCSLKQPDGGFQIASGGEEDVRGAYCAASIISILDLPLNLSPDSPAWTPEKPTLFTGLAEYVQKCQTYEGGISSQPGTEAHGGYAFCALACLSILDSPDRSMTRYLDVPRLVSWLSSRQYAPEGGFSGRTNKLVDGCYSHWVGDCWPLVEACLARQKKTDNPAAAAPASLFSREGLIRYILCCCQDQTKRGGLRDKPGKMSDPYHTCYVLSGLSSAQHKWELVDNDTDVGSGGVGSGDSRDTGLPGADSTTAWKVFPFTEDDGRQVFDEQDRVNTVHPVYTIAADRVEQIQAYFRAKSSF